MLSPAAHCGSLIASHVQAWQPPARGCKWAANVSPRRMIQGSSVRHDVHYRFVLYTTNVQSLWHMPMHATVKSPVVKGWLDTACMVYRQIRQWRPCELQHARPCHFNFHRKFETGLSHELSKAQARSRKCRSYSSTPCRSLKQASLGDDDAASCACAQCASKPATALLHLASAAVRLPASPGCSCRWHGACCRMLCQACGGKGDWRGGAAPSRGLLCGEVHLTGVQMDGSSPV